MKITDIASSMIKSPSLEAPKKGDPSFQDLIQDQLEKLNQSQREADQMSEAFIRGEVEDLHAVMIATEEARISLDLALQIRNKAVEAYKEINNMQL